MTTPSVLASSSPNRKRALQESTNMSRPLVSTIVQAIELKNPPPLDTSTSTLPRQKVSSFSRDDNRRRDSDELFPLPLGSRFSQGRNNPSSFVAATASASPVTSPLAMSSLPVAHRPPSPTTMHDTQIRLLERAISILKTHAFEAASNLSKLRSLTVTPASDESDVNSPRFKALQRKRWLEERRELDAHRALWGACQHVEALVNRDAMFFQEESKAAERKKKWLEKEAEKDVRGGFFPSDYEARTETPLYPLSSGTRRRRPRELSASPADQELATSTSQHPHTAISTDSEHPSIPTTAPASPPSTNQSTRVHKHSRILPLALASMADPVALQPRPRTQQTQNRVSSTSSSGSSSDGGVLRTPAGMVYQALEPMVVREESEVDDDVRMRGVPSGTVTIYRSTVATSHSADSLDDEAGDVTVDQADGSDVNATQKTKSQHPTANRQSKSKSKSKIKVDVDVPVAMPSYVADLLSGFDAESPVDGAGLVLMSSADLDAISNARTSSGSVASGKEGVVVPPARFSTGSAMGSIGGALAEMGLGGIGSPTPSSSSAHGHAEPQSPPSSPATKKLLRKIPSKNRFSGFFASGGKRASVVSPPSSFAQQGQSQHHPYPYPSQALATRSSQVPSRLGSSIDLIRVIPEDRPFSLELELGLEELRMSLDSGARASSEGGSQVHDIPGPLKRLSGSAVRSANSSQSSIASARGQSLDYTALYTHAPATPTKMIHVTSAPPDTPSFNLKVGGGAGSSAVSPTTKAASVGRRSESSLDVGLLKPAGAVADTPGKGGLGRKLRKKISALRF
ncbi:hypothetical protein FA15DRAFT_500883 [Coprinopsis marcescibilis]|uniref:Uncharacterized protein n=1 Tax=Coprinopsis marcescibilis TaxID=230819 RepID=A0A5C3KQT4_COPMA|nr:hypothetical protein FA15DRAFT_500883 [Coprinopsis marcescibilis]